MLKDAKAATREFEPPKDAWKSVPIGSSSDTMYPGYSPKDVEYGKAAEEFGKQWSEAKKQGIEFSTGPDGPEYEFAQSKQAKKRRLAELQQGESRAPGKVEASLANGNTVTASSENAGGDPLFFVDTNPTPVASKGFTKAETVAAAPAEPVIEYENIDAEVDARLKAKEEAKKGKKDKKRKRESAASAETEVIEESVDAAVATADAAEIEKPKKKMSKSKKDKSDDAAAGAVPEPVDVEMQDAEPEAEPVVKEEKKKSKKEKRGSDGAETEHKKKKTKKSKKDD